MIKGCRMKIKLLSLTLVVIFLLAFTGSAFAWTSEITERPFRFSDGGGAPGYYVWQDAYGFHLWALPGTGSHIFMGTIRTNGRFYNIREHHLDGGESFKTYPDIQDNFLFEISPTSEERFVFPGVEAECDVHKIFFKFSTSDASDGLHFDVSDASYVSFELLMDGHGIARNQIWYGKSSWHPETNVFKFENK